MQLGVSSIDSILCTCGWLSALKCKGWIDIGGVNQKLVFDWLYIKALGFPEC